MKKYNAIVLFILILITISVSSYFFFLDIIYKDKIVKEDVETLYSLKRTASKPIVVSTDEAGLKAKCDEYNEIIRELNLDAVAEVEAEHLVIRGAIHNSYSYILLKRLLDLLKNDEVRIENVCIGKSCVEEPYGFVIEFWPYTLNL